jgi:hypothetical protein
MDKKINDIVESIKRGYGWISIQSLKHEYEPKMNSFVFRKLVARLADDRMLVNEDYLPNVNIENMEALRDTMAIITFKTYVKLFESPKPIEYNTAFLTLCNKRFKLGTPAPYGIIIGKRLVSINRLEVSFDQRGEIFSAEFQMDGWDNLIEI